MIGTALLVFPKLALGLSGFETGVVVMPLVKGDINGSPPHIESQHLTRPGESAAQLSGRIHNTRKLLTVRGAHHELPAYLRAALSRRC